MVLPSKTMVPSVGGMTPVMALNNVVLPAPLGPMIARRCPRGTVSADAVDSTQGVEGDDNVGEGENGFSH